RIDLRDNRPKIAFDLIDELAEPAHQQAGGDENDDLDDRHRERRDGNDAEKRLRPGVHVSSRRALSYASRPRSMALFSVSRPCLTPRGPPAAISFALSRPSRAFSPRKSRVSLPVAGAYSSATAAPATAPTKNASITVPAPAPSSLAILPSAPSCPS